MWELGSQQEIEMRWMMADDDKNGGIGGR